MSLFPPTKPRLSGEGSRAVWAQRVPPFLTPGSRDTTRHGDKGARPHFLHMELAEKRLVSLVSWCFKPSQPQRITSGLNTNFTLSPSYSFQKSSYHKSCFLSLFIFHGHSTREPSSSRETYFILRAYTGTGVSHSQQRKKSGDVLKKMQVNGPEG